MASASDRFDRPARNGLKERSDALPSRISNLMFGFCGSQALFAACELGVFETLYSSGEPLSADVIAKKLGTDLDATCRLLDALVCVELLEKLPPSSGELPPSSGELPPSSDELPPSSGELPTSSGELPSSSGELPPSSGELPPSSGELPPSSVDPPPRYSNTSITDQFLLDNSPNSVKHSMAFGSKVLYQLFGNLSSAVRDGTNQWKRTFPHSPSAEDFFQSSYATEEGVMRVLQAMRGTCKPAAPAVVRAFDLRQFSIMCDLGGGTGDLAYATSTAYPNMTISVLDLPPVVKCAPHFRPSSEECPNQRNVSFVSADFFKDELPAADLYSLTHILHDWAEDKIDLLLGKVFKSLPSGGALLIGELLLTDSKTGPFEGVIASLSMLVLCDKGARERSEHEYRQLLERHGFVDVKAKRTGTTLMDAILCRKP